MSKTGSAAKVKLNSFDDLFDNSEMQTAGRNLMSKGTCHRQPVYQGKDGSGHSGVEAETDEGEPYKPEIPSGG